MFTCTFVKGNHFPDDDGVPMPPGILPVSPELEEIYLYSRPRVRPIYPYPYTETVNFKVSNVS